QNNAARNVLLGAAGNLDSFLKSLGSVITFGPFDSLDRDRISQLINKSNQFNLTTRRYAPADVLAMQCDSKIFTLQARLSDRFGDNGLITIIICRKSMDIWDIDTWLMSCRVLGRRVEEAALQEIVRHAQGAGASCLRGTYIPSQRNSLVKDHYAKLGFSPSGTSDDGSSIWTLSIADFKPIELPMKSVAISAAKLR